MNDEVFTKIGIMKEGVGRLVLEILQPDPTEASLGLLKIAENSTLDELLEALGIIYAVLSVAPEGLIREALTVSSFLADENKATYPKTDYDDVGRLLDLLDGKSANDFYGADMTDREKKLIYIMACRVRVIGKLRERGIVDLAPAVSETNTGVAEWS